MGLHDSFTMSTQRPPSGNTEDTHTHEQRLRHCQWLCGGGGEGVGGEGGAATVGVKHLREELHLRRLLRVVLGEEELQLKHSALLHSGIAQ
jgi:hypothetical protein